MAVLCAPTPQPLRGTWQIGTRRTLAPAQRPGTEAADCGNSGAGRLVLRTRNSYKSCRESIAHVRFKRGTRIIGLLVPLIPKFRARVCRECLRNFGIGTLAAVTKV